MSASAEVSASSAAAGATAPRLWGSELLLLKVPLYAQARQYAAVDPEEPQSECNTLAYGVSRYPLLAAVRAAYNAVEGDEEAVGPATSSLAVDPADLISRSPFHGIHSAGYAHVPAQRKWVSAAVVWTADAAPSRPNTATEVVVRRAAAATVLDDALGPPTLAQVLEPWFGVLEDRLALDAQAQEQDGDSATRTKAAASTDEGDVTRGVRIISPDVLRCERRKRLYDREAEGRGAVYTRVESAMMHYSAATAEEKDVLRIARVGSGGDGVTGTAVEVRGAAAVSTSVAPEAWGARMLSLVTSTVANERGSLNDESAEQQQKVFAYLKRVRWIATQWNNAHDPSVLRDVAAAASSWSRMTEASRVQTEMMHTQGQRRRFRRTRRGPASGANNADEGDAIDN